MTAIAEPSECLLRRRHARDMFACMLAVSVLMHLAASVLFILPARYPSSGVSPLSVDLHALSIQSEPLPDPNREEGEDAEGEEAESAPSPETLPESAKLERAIERTLEKGVQAPDAVHESAIGLGMVSGHFASFAEGESLKDDIREYYFSLMRRINEVWWLRGRGGQGLGAPAAVNIMIARDGKLLSCEFLQSTGSREQDAALLESIKSAAPLPPLPASYRWPTFNAPIRFVPPLRLMFPGQNRSPHGAR